MTKLSLFFSRNERVIAVMKPNDARLHGTIRQCTGDPTLANIRPFLFFCSNNAKDITRLEKQLFVGSTDFLDSLLAPCNLELVNNKPEESGWDGVIPFFGDGDASPLQNLDNVKHVATPEEFIKMIGLLDIARRNMKT